MWEWTVRTQIVYVAAGVATVFLFSNGRSLPTVEAFIVRSLPNVPLPARHFVNLVLTALVGAFAAVMVLAPPTPQNGFAAGLASGALLNFCGRRKS